MKPFILFTASAFALTLAACGGADGDAPAPIPAADAPMDMADGTMDPVSYTHLTLPTTPYV